MHGMLFQLCVHVLIFVMLAFFYCLIAWQLFKIFRIVTAPFIAIRETALFPQDVRDRFTPRGAYTSRLSKFCSKTSSENLYREGFPAAQQFFHTNLAARRCYWHNNRYTIVDIEVPNDSVDKSSWESSACYPRRTFDPLSESPSTRDSRITMADFRLCSTSRSHSQAGLYHYAHEQNLSLSLPSHTSPLVLRIFTENSISPGPCRRQRGSRYTIRAGRYLCDKEFRYLRTVRVTAAVYRGFHSKLITLLLPTFQHRAGVRLYTSCYHLAESCVFNKQSLPPVHREDRPPNSKFFPGSFNLVDYDNSRDYKQTRDYGRAGDRARPSQKGFDDSSKVHIRERRVRGRGGSPRPDHPIHSNRQAWFCSQSNFVTFVYPSDGSPFGACIRSFPGVGKAKWGHPSPLSALPRAIDIIRSTEIDFAENQLYPILVGLSPLATSHPRILPHTWVRSSKACSKLLRLIVRIGSQVLYCTPYLGFFSPFPHGTCTLSVIEEYLGLEGGPPFSRKSDQNSNTPRFTGKDRTMGTNLQGYHLLWPDLPTFSQLQFTAPFK
ncbi:hypothetical protein VNO77_47084 [Canavalia gladiata]